MVQYSKHAFGCQASKDTEPDHVGLLCLKKLGKYWGEIFLEQTL